MSGRAREKKERIRSGQERFTECNSGVSRRGVAVRSSVEFSVRLSSNRSSSFKFSLMR